ncbi:MAG: SDR family oxidoreductase [Pseudomonadota bacterium]|nr:SDR family oxidoreductase [Pseudomonadota bacterium]
MKILVTGANGFIGKALCKKLRNQQHDVIAAVRRRCNISNVTILENEYSWEKALMNQDILIHTAGLSQVRKDTEIDPLEVYRSVNVQKTRILAQQAAASGVKLFIFLSSIKVNGELTKTNSYFSFRDEASPKEPYSISKWEAEQTLREIAAKTNLKIVIIRSPLVYGPGVKGNFLSLLNLLDRGIPLPFGSIKNKRSLVGLNNLIDLIITCTERPAAANKTFLVSDDDDLSTTELLQRLACALNKPVKLLPFPTSILQLGASLLGRRDTAQRLLGNLQLDISHTKKALDWSPPEGIETCLKETASWYLSKK